MSLTTSNIYEIMPTLVNVFIVFNIPIHSSLMPKFPQLVLRNNKKHNISKSGTFSFGCSLILSLENAQDGVFFVNPHFFLKF